MNITWIDLMVLFLASFRLTRLMVYDDIMEKLRKPFFMEVEEMTEEGKKEVFIVPKKWGITGFVGRMLNCYWCTGVWSAAICCLFYLLLPSVAAVLLLILAVAGGAAIIEIIIQSLGEEN